MVFTGRVSYAGNFYIFNPLELNLDVFKMQGFIYRKFVSKYLISKICYKSGSEYKFYNDYKGGFFLILVMFRFKRQLPS